MITCRTLRISLICLAVVALLVGCQPSPSSPGATPTQPATTSAPLPKTPMPTQGPSATPLATATPVPTPTSTASSAATLGLAASALAEIATVQAQVAEVRGLATSVDPPLDVRDKQGIEQYLQEKLSEEFSLEEELRQLVTLSVLGLISPTLDLRAFYQEAYAEQIIGAYDFRRDEMILTERNEFDATARMTYAHEFVHALLDQNFDVDGKLGFNSEECEDNPERCAAIQALMEGDATLASTTWLQTFGTEQDQADVAQDSQVDMPVLQNAPLAFVEQLMFPYTVGTAFVNYLFQKGGWKAVDQAYLDPPVTTEQIMHPERYPADKPQEVTLPDLLPVLGEGWALLEQEIMGEWSTLLLLAAGIDPDARLSSAEAIPAVAGWGGDIYAVYFHDATGQSVLVLKTKWETTAEAEEFATALAAHINARVDLTEEEHAKTEAILGSGIAYVQSKLQDDMTFYVLSPSKEMSEAILKAVL